MIFEEKYFSRSINWPNFLAWFWKIAQSSKENTSEFFKHTSFVEYLQMIASYFVRGLQPSFLRHPPLDSVYPHFLKSLFPSPLFCSTPFQGILDSPTTLKEPPPALIQSTNLLWFKQISKGWFYQFNCCFLSKSNFYGSITQRITQFCKGQSNF